MFIYRSWLLLFSNSFKPPHTCRKTFRMQGFVFSAVLWTTWKRNPKTLACFCEHHEVILPLMCLFIHHLGCAPRRQTRRALLSRRCWWSRCSCKGCIHEPTGRWTIEGTVCLIMTSCCPVPSGLLPSHQRSDEDPDQTTPDRSERETCLFSFNLVTDYNIY